jgi:hypothetical protein
MIPVLLQSRAAASQTAGVQLRALLPQGTAAVEVLELWVPPRMNELILRFQRAAQSDPSWFLEHAKRAHPGTPLPYDPKLGLTREEYREFLAFQDSMQMRPIRNDTVIVEHTAVGWRFGAPTSIRGLRGLEIDTVRNLIHSAFGDLTAAAPITPKPEQRATGPWGGPQWKLQDYDPNFDPMTITGTTATFAVGKHATTGHTIIYFEAKRAVNGQIVAREDLFLRVVH